MTLPVPAHSAPEHAIPPQRMNAAEALEVMFSDYAPNTRRAYARAFREFQAWAGFREFKELATLDPLQVVAFKTHLREQGHKPASINQTLSALRKIGKLLAEFGFLARNPFATSILRSEKVSATSNKGALQVSDIHAMLHANEMLEYDPRFALLLRRRNGVLLKFLYFTATRRSEVADLRWDDLGQDGVHQVARLRQTKSGVEQKIKIRTELHLELVRWRALQEEQGLSAPWVFPSLSARTFGQKMSGKGVNDVVIRLGREVGLKISAHYLRHTAITTALELGEPLQKVQAYARHASADTTIRYFHDRQLLEQNPTDRLPSL